MEVKKPHPPSASNAHTSSHPDPPRRRPGGPKRKAASSSSSAPSKRLAKDRHSPYAPVPPLHNGPVTRARQSPNKLVAPLDHSRSPARVVVSSETNNNPGDSSAASPEDAEPEKEEPFVDLDFEAIRSRGSTVHVVPTHAGWFDWGKVHPLEERSMASFFDGKTDGRTPEVYVGIRDAIVGKFHANPKAQIEPKDLVELPLDGDVDATQEVLEFVDHWGLVNFHPFPQSDSSKVPDCEGEAKEGKDPEIEGESERSSLLEKLYMFDELQPQVRSKGAAVKKLGSSSAPVAQPRLLTESDSKVFEGAAKPEEPSVEYHCNACTADCSRKRYHCQKQADFDLCTECYNAEKFGQGMAASDFILMDSAVRGGSGGSWTDQETLLLLEALELFGSNWNEIAEHVATKTKAQCILHFIEMPIEDPFLEDSDDPDVLCPGTACQISANVTSDASNFPENANSKSSENGEMPSTPSKDLSTKNHCDELPDANKIISNVAMDALTKAFQAVDSFTELEGSLSFAEAGNPVMALAAFIAGIVEPESAMISTKSSIKAIYDDSPGIQLATRHCFTLDDPPTCKIGQENKMDDPPNSTNDQENKMDDPPNSTNDQENKMDDPPNSTNDQENKMDDPPNSTNDQKNKMDDSPNSTNDQEITCNESSASGSQVVQEGNQIQINNGSEETKETMDTETKINRKRGAETMESDANKKQKTEKDLPVSSEKCPQTPSRSEPGNLSVPKNESCDTPCEENESSDAPCLENEPSDSAKDRDISNHRQDRASLLLDEKAEDGIKAQKDSPCPREGTVISPPGTSKEIEHAMEEDKLEHEQDSRNADKDADSAQEAKMSAEEAKMSADRNSVSRNADKDAHSAQAAKMPTDGNTVCSTAADDTELNQTITHSGDGDAKLASNEVKTIVEHTSLEKESKADDAGDINDDAEGGGKADNADNKNGNAGDGRKADNPDKNGNQADDSGNKNVGEGRKAEDTGNKNVREGREADDTGNKKDDVWEDRKADGADKKNDNAGECGKADPGCMNVGAGEGTRAEDVAKTNDDAGEGRKANDTGNKNDGVEESSKAEDTGNKNDGVEEGRKAEDTGGNKNDGVEEGRKAGNTVHKNDGVEEGRKADDTGNKDDSVEEEGRKADNTGNKNDGVEEGRKADDTKNDDVGEVRKADDAGSKNGDAGESRKTDDAGSKNDDIEEARKADDGGNNNDVVGESRKAENIGNKEDVRGGSKADDTSNQNDFKRIKRAAATAIAAAAVKAKVLARQEVDQTRKLVSMVIGKQLHKLEIKLALLNDVDGLIMRIREQLDRTRRKLLHERTKIIAARFGAPASSSRPLQGSVPLRVAPSGPRQSNTALEKPPAAKP